ncbi:MAG TPA: serine/threonine-protein kinase [Labilithrix sp.]|nr:serine/threonine-protein kinase [Labilithrix sp.]
MLGNYRAIAKLGHGGMAEVRLAIAQRAGGFNKLLVLKLLREELSADQEFLEMFLAEARVAALLNHPNIVQTNEVGVENGRHFIAMEYLEGQPLSALLARVGRNKLPLDLHVYILAQMLHGLHYAHELTDFNGTPLSVIHRDVSPQNVFVTYSGQVKLLDFGIAKVAGAVGLTKTGILKGKVGYMAPEQARMQMNLDRRADVFAVGVMLWEAITRQRFVPSGEPELSALQRRLGDEDLKLADVAPDADPALAAICNKAVAFDRDQRWLDAQSFAEALEAWLTRPKHVIEKELGRLLVDKFGEERSRIRRVVEEESAKPFTAGDAPSANLREISSTLDGTPATTGSYSDVATGVATSATMAAADRSRKVKLTVAVGLLAAFALGGVAVVKFGNGGKSVGTDVTTSATETKPVTPAQIAVRVRAVPSSVTFTIDNGPSRSIPYDGSVVKEDSSHKLRFSAEGYESEERVVTFNNDVDLDITLRKSATPADSASAAAVKPQPQPQWGRAPVRPKAPDTPPEPQPQPKKAKHSIDEQDPYAK